MKIRNVVMRDELSTEGLLDMIKELGDVKKKTMVEIGSFIGESTILFARQFKHVSTIDPFLPNYDPQDPTSQFNFDEVYEEYLKRIDEKKDVITTYKMTSNDALSVLSDMKFDFVYIDGIHQYDNVYMDIMNYLPLVKKGGYIGGHDYGGYWKGVKEAVDKIFGAPDKTFKDFSWIKKV